MAGFTFCPQCQWANLRSRLSGLPAMVSLVLVFGISGCAQHSRHSVTPVELGVVKFVPAPGLPTEIESIISTPFQWNTLGRGAVQGIGQCTRMRVQGGPEALLQWLVCFPISAVIGAIAGFAREPPPQTINVDDLTGFFESGQFQPMISEYASVYAQNVGMNVLAPLDEVNPDAATAAVSADTQIEIWVKKIKLNCASNAGRMVVILDLTLDVNIRETGDGLALKHFEVSLESKPYTYYYWLSDDYAPLHDFVKKAMQKLIAKTVTAT